MTELTPPRDPRPHSRACGTTAHDHGPACHANCPTCAEGSADVHVETPPRDTTDTEALADALAEVHSYRAAHGGGWDVLAADFLASDWLRDRDAALRAEALREAADEIDRHGGFDDGLTWAEQMKVSPMTRMLAWLRERADRIAGGAL